MGESVITVSFECDMVVGAWEAGLICHFPEQQSQVYTEKQKTSCEQQICRSALLVRNAREAGLSWQKVHSKKKKNNKK